MANGRFTRGKFLRMVDPRYNTSHRGASAGTIPVIIAVFVWLFMCVWLSSQAVKFNYEINELTKTRDKLKTSNRTLEFRVQGMMSSEGIAKAAKERYGFRDQDDNQVVVIKRKKDLLAKIMDIFKNIGKNSGSI